MNLSTEKFFANKRSDKYSKDSNFKNTFIGKKLADNLITDNKNKSLKQTNFRHIL